MKKAKVLFLVQLCIPLVLLIIFSLIIVFPSKVPFLQIHVSSWDGIGQESFSVPGRNGKENGVKFIMKRVPSGVCPSGCTDIPGGTTVAHPFLLGETEVTSEIWNAVVAASVSKGYEFSRKEWPSRDKRYPVEGVSWRDALVWCNALSETSGLVPVYYADAGFLSPVRSEVGLEAIADDVFVRPEADGFRLPFSAEWELAARYIDGIEWTPGGNPSGSTHVYFSGSFVDAYAVYLDERANPVRSKASNRLGIYDMSGNVWEWCFDRFSEDERGSDAYVKRVVRGGSWSSNAYRMQIGGKFGTLPDAIESGQGFRIARSGW